MPLIVFHSSPVFFEGITDVNNFRKQWSFQVVANAFLAVESFFFVTGVLISYSVLKLCTSFNTSFVILLLLRRIWRLLPSVLLLAGVLLLLPLTGSGPLWKETMGGLADTCRNNWWTLPIFITNALSFEKMCVPHSWYVCSDFQLLVFSLFFFPLYFRRKSWGYSFLAFLVLLSSFITGLLTFYYDLPPTVLLSVPEVRYFLHFTDLIYTKPSTHLGVYAIGLAVGCYLAGLQKTRPFSKATNWIGWLSAIIASLAVVYGTLNWNTEVRPGVVESVVYAALHRPIWAMCLAWVVLSCANGTAGPVLNLLSWKGYGPLVRVSYLTYLVHVPIIFVFVASRTSTITINHSNMVWLFSGFLLVSLIAAFVLRVVFEGPLMQLENIFFQWLRDRKADKDDSTQL